MTQAMDCVCLLHGSAYDWIYVENLHRQLAGHIQAPINLHVLTEPDRAVPPGYQRHDLWPWPRATGPRRAWWNKLQLFRPDLFTGPVLYFDLDIVILRDITYMCHVNLDYFWTLRDFRYLWRPNWSGINSSIMVWSGHRYHWIWDRVQAQDIDKIMDQYPGDQDYLSRLIPAAEIQFFEDQRFQSWRWQVWDGGMDLRTRQCREPGRGPQPSPDCDAVIFHGRPKPHQINHPWIQRHWSGLGC